ncbi:hypothetical protein QBC37DRAFT_393396 [Rhypophila decipiens]|uniref:Uncharacterized protein n=1 Tax=Rhypophila decipiens TaxID=261697 RepID=A0AAN6XXW4_9PEZI|nr:hypothetical protein QBC37DRAFT_393396 [Rhypophila decipiens]
MYTEVNGLQAVNLAAPAQRKEEFIARIGLKPSWIKCFFESSLLVKAFTLTCHKESPARAIRQEETLELPRTHGLEKASDCYLNKLAYLCSNTPDSGDITGISLLRDPENIFYVFGSNNRTSRELDEAVQFIRSLFQAVNVDDTVLDTQQEQLTNGLMTEILFFHRDRVKVYLNMLGKELARAVDMDKNHPSTPYLKRILPVVTDAREILGACEKSHPRSARHLQLNATAHEYVSTMQSLFPELEILKRRIGDFRDQSHGASYSWEASLDEILHFIGRLLSYTTAPAILLAARQTWPEIFADDVAILPISSSSPMPNPFPRSRQNSPPEDLINRLFTDVIERDTCLEQAQHLQHLTNRQLDFELRKQFECKSFKPYVHCEILVHDWIVRWAGGYPTTDMFFFRRKYIGVGKSTCQLCWSYLSNHNSAIGVRPSHGNVYTAWRMPDSYAALDFEAEQERIRVLHRVRDDMRQLCKRTLADGRARRKNGDSETSSSRPTVWGAFLDAPRSGLQDLESRMQRTRIEETDPRSRDDGGFEQAGETASVLAPVLLNVDVGCVGEDSDPNFIERVSGGDDLSRSTTSVDSVDDNGGSTSGVDESSLSGAEEDIPDKDIMAKQARDETEVESDGGGFVLYTGRRRKVKGKERVR